MRLWLSAEAVSRGSVHGGLVGVAGGGELLDGVVQHGLGGGDVLEEIDLAGELDDEGFGSVAVHR